MKTLEQKQQALRNFDTWLDDWYRTNPLQFHIVAMGTASAIFLLGGLLFGF